MSEEKQAVQRQFAKNATDYRDEKFFASGDDLQMMVKAVPLTGNEKLLDIGTGAGHTALAFAPFVAEGIGLDITEEMVRVATAYAKTDGTANVTFRQGDAEQLPFPDATFDIVTCRMAAHHFPQVEKAVREISRVLKPGGHFLLVDHYAPEAPLLDRFINTLDKLRDPSHIREYTLSEWRALFATGSFAYREVAKWDLPLNVSDWLARARTPSERRQQVVTLFKSDMPPQCRETFCLSFDGDGNPHTFCLKAVLLHGLKENVRQ
ncbi:class I SAM-dependent methyltransferase [Numidum massiliense]|uniref:class I SAM-dependent methyltransferase n=1 Tax=Numidum massiliense TaxID=1522315 RepID=UPI0006D54229|nr:class I SAM-dependent methyltransferase [Numidum massiliense]